MNEKNRIIKSAEAALFAGAMILLYLGGPLFAILRIWGKQMLLTSREYLILQGLAAVIGILFLFGGLFLRTRKWLLSCTASLAVMAILSALQFGVNALKRLDQAGWLALGLLMYAVAAVLLTAVFFRVVQKEVDLKKAVLTAVCFLIILMLAIPARLIPVRTALGRIALLAIAAGISYMLLVWLLDRQEEEGVWEPPMWFRLALPVVFLIAGVLCWVLPNRAVLKNKAPEAVVTAGMDHLEALAWYKAEEEMNLDATVQLLRQEQVRVKAIAIFCGEDKETSFEELLQQSPKDPWIARIGFACGRSAADVEQRLVTGEYGIAWYPTMLEYYAGLENQTVVQKQLAQEMLMTCLNQEEWVADLPDWKEIGEAKYKLWNAMAAYQDLEETADLLDLVRRYELETDDTQKLVLEALTYAEEHPDLIASQYLACQLGSAYHTDSANHYQRTIEAAKRYDKLYGAGERSLEELSAEKAEVAGICALCYDFDQARSFYEKANLLVQKEEYVLMAAACSVQTGDDASCLRLAKRVLDQNPESQEALYLESISALKTGDEDLALEAAGLLSLQTVEDTSQELEQKLYTLVQFFVISDNTRYTSYKYRLFNRLSDEQKADLEKKYPVLLYYMQATDACFNGNNFEATKEAADKLLAIREDYIFAWYLQGSCCYSNYEYEKALEYLLKAEKLSSQVPAILYAIANTYDGLEDYENAYLYSARIAQLVPEQDHGSDVYGISYHNRNLLNALKEKLGEEE